MLALSLSYYVGEPDGFVWITRKRNLIRMYISLRSATLLYSFYIAGNVQHLITTPPQPHIFIYLYV